VGESPEECLRRTLGEVLARARAFALGVAVATGLAPGTDQVQGQGRGRGRGRGGLPRLATAVMCLAGLAAGAVGAAPTVLSSPPVVRRLTGAASQRLGGGARLAVDRVQLRWRRPVQVDGLRVVGPGREGQQELFRCDRISSGGTLWGMLRGGARDFAVLGMKADLSLSPGNGQMRVVNLAESANLVPSVRPGLSDPVPYVPPPLTISSEKARLDVHLAVAAGQAAKASLTIPDAQLWMPKDMADVVGRNLKLRLRIGSEAALQELVSDVGLRDSTPRGLGIGLLPGGGRETAGDARTPVGVDLVVDPDGTVIDEPASAPPGGSPGETAGLDLRERLGDVLTPGEVHEECRRVVENSMFLGRPRQEGWKAVVGSFESETLAAHLSGAAMKDRTGASRLFLARPIAVKASVTPGMARAGLARIHPLLASVAGVDRERGAGEIQLSITSKDGILPALEATTVTVSPVRLRLRKSELLRKVFEALKVPDKALLGSSVDVQVWLGKTVIDIRPRGRWALHRSDLLVMGKPGVHLALWGEIDPFSLATDATLAIPLSTLEDLSITRRGREGSPADKALAVRLSGQGQSLSVDWKSLSRQIALLVVEGSVDPQQMEQPSSWQSFAMGVIKGVLADPGSVAADAPPPHLPFPWQEAAATPGDRPRGSSE